MENDHDHDHDVDDDKYIATIMMTIVIVDDNDVAGDAHNDKVSPKVGICQ